ncbi:hypothetical protein HZH66_005698 [Vespula vulgaris]|uniref:Uncharacterized protein n=1 Tax=Vespula vulgaris TaxID=7454 RepID=A0A834K8W9_VESVU|nr:hypothetical protein HZH66_005698 [Vespula vulgaris]
MHNDWNESEEGTKTFNISLRKFVAIAVLAILTILASTVNSVATSKPVAAGAITVYPIPQRPPYAPNPWDYPRPIPTQSSNRRS